MSYYEPKKIFVKTENGAYTEITYQEFCKRRNADPSYKKRLIIPIQGSLLEVNEDTYREFYQAKEREEYVEECKQDVGEISYEVYKETNKDNNNLTVNEPYEDVVKELVIEKMWKCLEQLSDSDRLIIEKIYFERYTERQLAEELEVSQTTIHRKKKRILKALKKKIGK